MTCDTALRRVIIIRKDSMTTASAIPSVLRLTVLASSEIGWAEPNEKITSTIPISMVVGILMSVSVSHFTSSLRIRRYRIHGRTMTFSASVRPAE